MHPEGAEEIFQGREAPTPGSCLHENPLLLPLPQFPRLCGGALTSSCSAGTVPPLPSNVTGSHLNLGGTQKCKPGTS